MSKKIVKCKRTIFTVKKKTQNVARGTLVQRPWLLHITDGVPSWHRHQLPSLSRFSHYPDQDHPGHPGGDHHHYPGHLTVKVMVIMVVTFKGMITLTMMVMIFQGNI